MAVSRETTDKKSERKPTTTWAQLAKKHISHRSSDEMGEAWRQIGEVVDAPSLQSVVLDVYKRSDFNFETFSELKPLVGAQTAAITELRRIKAKAEAAINVADDLYYSGRLTWAAVDGYHSCFLTAKVILGVFGIFIVSIDGANFFLDVFPSVGDKEYKKSYDKEARGISSPVRFMSINGKAVEHRHVWELLRRIGNKCTIDCLNEMEQKWFKNFDFDAYRPIRNKIIYNSYYWSDFSDLHAPIADIPPSIDIDSSEYIDNIWITGDRRDHVLMSIMSSYMRRMYPFESNIYGI